MTSPGWNIGQAARKLQLSTPTLRYYEKLGLLRAHRRGQGRYRFYSPEDLQRLRLIRQFQDSLCFTLREIKEVLDLVGKGEAGFVKLRGLLERHILRVHQRILACTRLEKRLLRALQEIKRYASNGGFVGSLDIDAMLKVKLE